jgi:glycine cleavage system transcriptional repressor
MTKYLSLSAIGKDKAGIVSALSRVLYDCGANIEDSTMTILHGQFAVILILKVNTSNFSKLKMLLAAVAKKLQLNISISEIKALKNAKPTGNPYIISVYGADKTGIVYRVSQTLADFGVNITDVQTKIVTSKSKKTYLMLIEADLPKKLSLTTLKKALGGLAQEMAVHISINKSVGERL